MKSWRFQFQEGPGASVVPVHLWLRLWVSGVLTLGGLGPVLGAEPGWIGVARRDITPGYPVRLTGYAARTNMSTGAAQPLWAKALAMGTDEAGPRILITVDNCGVPAAVVEEVAGRLALRRGIRRGDFAVASSHTHSAPMARGFAENIFIRDLTPEEAGASDRYTRELADHLEAVAVEALAERRSGRLFRAEGKVDFAANRRTPGGPVDHSLPILVVRGDDGRARAVVANYACHCTTLGSQVNQAHGDWAGFAQEFIEADHPGAVAMITIGCGADSNPSPRGGDDFGVTWARTHARALATEVKWLVDGRLEALPGLPATAHVRLWLPFEPLPTRAEWEKRAKEPAIVGYHARKNLARLDRGEVLPERLPYFVQTWSFGDRLAMVFLAGEVVVDYALRLKREFDPGRLWITGYANDVPCYIPSRRILSEGGYEAESSLWYYDRPARLSGEIEDLIHGAVTNRLPAELRVDPKRADLPPARSPEASLLALRTRPGLRVDLVAAEPLIESPVAIDFGADGRLWVCEMRDYPEGLDGKGAAGGRVRVLTDRNGDGRYDEAKTVVDGLAYPTGLMAWKDGVLVGAAPDVLFVSERDPPARADDPERVQRRLTGFATHNFQARVNGFRWGMDGWVYGSGGVFGGRVTVGTGANGGGEIDGSGRDFRWRPDTGEFEALAGVSQQGRIRDDFGEWFGNDNSTLLWHFPLADRYSRRNRHVAPPEPRSMANRDDARVFPLSRTLARFNDPHAANQLTSACGPEIYRDNHLGAGFHGNAFVCEPVHNLVRRAVLTAEGVSFGARRAEDERDREFLASADNWFRPVEVRTGPDGALWVVDMHRFVVEHPRWITAERLRELDVRAGADRGRIYRIHAVDRPPRPIRNLTRLNTAALVEVLASANGVERDLAQRLLGERNAGSPLRAPELARLEGFTGNTNLPVGVRVQSFHVLEGLGHLGDATLHPGLGDHDTRFVRALLPLAERRAGLRARLVQLAERAETGTDAGLAFQACLSLGEAASVTGSGEDEGGIVVGALARLGVWRRDRWVRAAWLSSATTPAAAEAMARVLMRGTSAGAGMAPGAGDAEGQAALMRTLKGFGFGAAEGFGRILVESMSGWTDADPDVAGRLGWILPMQEVLMADAGFRSAVLGADVSGVRAAAERLSDRIVPRVLAALEGRSGSGGLGLPREAIPGAIRLLGLEAERDPAAQDRLLALLERPELAGQRGPLVEAMGRCETPSFAAQILSGWSRRTPGSRSALVPVLLGREAFTEALAAAIERGDVQLNELDASQRARLIEHCDPERRGRILARSGGADTDRGGVLAAYASTSERTGDPGRGGAHFERLCATCHRVRGRGHAVGPDLGPFAVKPTAEYLVAMLDPNAAIDPRYVAYDVVLRDGRELGGVVRSETGTSVVLAQAGGVVETLLRSDLVSMTAQGRSLMPDGLEEGMAPQDFADLIAWLRTVPTRFGEVGIEAAADARRAFVAGGASRVTAVNSGFAALPYGGWLGMRPLHYCRQTDGRSRLEWKAEPVSGADVGRRRYRFAAAMGFHSQPAGDFGLSLEGREVLRFGVALGDAAWASADGTVQVRYTPMEVGAEDSCGVFEVECEGAAMPATTATFTVTGSATASERWFGIYHPVDAAP